MYDLKQANRTFACFNCSLYPVLDAGKVRLSEATRGSVLHWHVERLFTQPAQPLVLGSGHSVCPDPSCDLHHLSR